MTHHLTARLLAAATLALATIGLAAPATALPPGGADPDTPGTSVTVGPTQVAPGDRLSFTVTGFPAGETVYVKIDDGTQCDEAAVHGACVYHQQRISSSGSVSGSIAVPALKPGRHWLRFLASEPVMRDGEQVGVKGYTARGRSDFTVVAASGAAAGSDQGSDSGGAAGTAPGEDEGSAGSPAASSAATQAATPGEVVKVAPPATTKPTEVAPTPAATDEPVAAPATETTATSDDAGFPWVGALGLVGLVAVSFAGTRLALARCS
ncbi:MULTISPECIES: hypothetical protein [unclassified Aeromicrobium]|uniref:hypothetical protein n=1 Tax=unclassified Aeromicrobium TaxID=2633570 RepID=UPI00396B21B9